MDLRRAIGSAGERLVHTEEVTGSIPVSPTSSEAKTAATTTPAIRQRDLAASYKALHEAYRQRETVFAAIMADRADWEAAD